MFMLMSFSNVKHVMPSMQFCHGICLTLLNLIVITSCRTCNTTQYEIDGECCLMCAPGLHVLQHCDSYSGTKCKECTGSTYTDVPNGLTSCLSCTVCDEGNGLRVKRKCVNHLDALCEPLPGYYCAEIVQKFNNESCRNAREHSSCLPGQYINQTGTALMDTVCKECSKETYSNGSSLHCEPHTNCESLGQMTVIQGTESSDAVCSYKPSHLGLVFGILLSLLLVIVILSAVVWKKRGKSTTL